MRRVFLQNIQPGESRTTSKVGHVRVDCFNYMMLNACWQFEEPILLSSKIEQLKDSKSILSPIGEDGSTGNYLFSCSVHPHQIISCSTTGNCYVIGLFGCRIFILVHPRFSCLATSRESSVFTGFLEKYRIHDIRLRTNAVKVSEAHFLAIFHVANKRSLESRQIIYDKYAYVIVFIFVA